MRLLISIIAAPISEISRAAIPLDKPTMAASPRAIDKIEMDELEMVQIVWQMRMDLWMNGLTDMNDLT